LRHEDEASEIYVLECDAVWSGTEIFTSVSQKIKTVAFSFRENKMALPLDMTKETVFHIPVSFDQTTQSYIPTHYI
jgi:hypothetical protein